MFVIDTRFCESAIYCHVIGQTVQLSTIYIWTCFTLATC